MAHNHIFVGNLPYDVTEEALQPLLEKCGKVRNIRLLTDPTTGKLKGFGFCEFADEASALCAIKNLNGREFGGRQLKVDFADKPKLSSAPKPEQRDSRAGGIPGQPPGNFGGFMDGHRQVTNALNTVPLPELYEAMEQLRSLAVNQPEQAKQILYANPQLGLAAFYVLHHMGIYEKDPRQGIPEHRGLRPAGLPGLPPGMPPLPGFPMPGLPMPPRGLMGSSGFPGLTHDTMAGAMPPLAFFPGPRGLPPMPPGLGGIPGLPHPEALGLPPVLPGFPPPGDLAPPPGLVPPGMPPNPRPPDTEQFNFQPPPQMPVQEPAQQPPAPPQLPQTPQAPTGMDGDSMVTQLAQLDAEQLKQLLELTPEQLAELPEAEREQVVQIKQHLEGLAGPWSGRSFVCRGPVAVHIGVLPIP